MSKIVPDDFLPVGCGLSAARQRAGADNGESWAMMAVYLGKR